MAPDKPTRIRNIPWRVVDDRAVIVQPASGMVHELNPVGLFLWARAEGTRGLDAMADDLCEHFEISRETALTDAREFFFDLAQHGLIQWES